MAYPATTLKTAEELCAALLAQCDTWRAVCAFPAATYDELASMITTGGLEAGDAAERIIKGGFADREELGGWLNRPRICLRRFDDNVFGKGGGYALRGVLYVEIQLLVPDGYAAEGQEADACHDAEKKILCLAGELLEVNRTVADGAMDITELAMGPTGLNDPNEEPARYRFAIGDFILRYGGAT